MRRPLALLTGPRAHREANVDRRHNAALQRVIHPHMELRAKRLLQFGIRQLRVF
jgi:hypothetical protein